MIENIKLIGKIVEISDRIERGRMFKKIFVLLVNAGDINENYYKIEAIGEKSLRLLDYRPGDHVKVTINIEGRMYMKNDKPNYWTNLVLKEITRFGKKRRRESHDEDPRQPWSNKDYDIGDERNESHPIDDHLPF